MDGVNVLIAVQKVYYPLLCIMGIPANLFTCYMICFRKCGMSETATVYLGCLALVDTFYLVWVILLDLCLVFLQVQPFWHSQPWCGIMGVLQYGALYSSSWIVVMFTIERYLVLSITIAKQRFHQARTALFICVTIILLSHIASVPMSWINTVTPTNITIKGQNITVPRCRYRDAMYATVLVWVTTFLSGGVPIVLIIIFNSLIAHHLICSSQLFTKEERRAIRGTNTRGIVRRTILLLGTVSIAFVVLSLPRFVTYCILRTKYNYREFDRSDYSMTINIISDLANMLQNLNSTTNFLLYCMVSRSFRQELVNTLTCQARTREPSSVLNQTTRTVKVFSVVDHKETLIIDPVHAVLTRLRRTEGS
ncbi:probable G-protein coupled receptor 139 [Myxocyprinus asiaticus]|uniref:probable G-protein coupled receptor 139 n=1 Tax=Myxocyprinus asiaticus TaxID=70543 RepID=UPI00222326D7|nr:probable G-protein coupled receptor 139 [Myxocyprinus asiaticus]